MGQFVEQGFEFDLTAEEIDRRLLLIGEFTRPNLLHNSRFQVNQRGTAFPFDFQGTSLRQDTAGLINKYVFDRWLFNNNDDGFGSGMVTMVDFINQYGTSFPKFEPLVDNSQPVFGQRLWVENRLTNNNPLFNQDVTISILTAEYGLLSATGHTPTRSDFNNTANGGANGTIGTDIIIPYASGTADFLAKLSCRRDGITKSKVQAAFYFQICCKEPVTVIAAKVEIGVGQTLAKKVGNQWVLIDQYDYYEDLKTCQRFYKAINIPTCAVVFDISNMNDTTGKYVCSIVLDDIANMVFRPTLVDVGRAYVTDGEHNAMLAQYDNGHYNINDEYASFIIGYGTYNHYFKNGNGNGMRAYIIIVIGSTTMNTMVWTGSTSRKICTIVDGVSGNNGQRYGEAAFILSAEV